MTYPNRCSVVIDNIEIQALSAKLALQSGREGNGQPEMGAIDTAISCWFDLHDRKNLPFATFAELFRLANRPTHDKIVPIELRFWDDEDHEDVVCTFSFDGWIHVFSMESPEADANTSGADNHRLYLELEPVLDEQMHKKIEVSN